MKYISELRLLKEVKIRYKAAQLEHRSGLSMKECASNTCIHYSCTKSYLLSPKIQRGVFIMDS